MDILTANKQSEIYWLPSLVGKVVPSSFKKFIGKWVVRPLCVQATSDRLLKHLPQDLRKVYSSSSDDLPSLKNELNSQMELRKTHIAFFEEIQTLLKQEGSLLPEKVVQLKELQKMENNPDLKQLENRLIQLLNKIFSAKNTPLLQDQLKEEGANLAKSLCSRMECDLHVLEDREKNVLSKIQWVETPSGKSICCKLLDTSSPLNTSPQDQKWIICLSGTRGNWQAHYNFEPRDFPNGFKVLFTNFSGGIGCKGKPSSPEDIVEGIKATVSHLEEKENACRKNISLVGISMGGAMMTLAAKALEDENKPTGRLIAINTFADLKKEVPYMIRSRIEKITSIFRIDLSKNKSRIGAFLTSMKVAALEFIDLIGRSLFRGLSIVSDVLHLRFWGLCKDIGNTLYDTLVFPCLIAAALISIPASLVHKSGIQIYTKMLNKLRPVSNATLVKVSKTPFIRWFFSNLLNATKWDINTKKAWDEIKGRKAVLHSNSKESWKKDIIIPFDLSLAKAVSKDHPELVDETLGKESQISFADQEAEIQAHIEKNSEPKQVYLHEHSHGWFPIRVLDTLLQEKQALPSE